MRRSIRGLLAPIENSPSRSMLFGLSRLARKIIPLWRVLICVAIRWSQVAVQIFRDAQ